MGLRSSSASLAPRTDSPRVTMSVMVCLSDAHAHAFCEFHLQLVVGDHLGDQADDAAAGDDAVAALDAGQHLALRLGLGLLRTDQQEIEDDEDEDEREELDEKIPAAARAACLRPCLRI